MVNWTGIGVGAQSTVGGKTFLLEKYVLKIKKNLMPEFHMPLASVGWIVTFEETIDCDRFWRQTSRFQLRFFGLP